MPGTKMWTARGAGVIGLGLLFLACSSTTVGTGDTGGDDEGDAAAEAGLSTDAAPGADATSTTDAGDGLEDACVGTDASDAAPSTDAAVCALGTPAGSYTYHPPLNPTNSCTSQQVQAYVTACGTGTTSVTCDPFRAANAPCMACLETKQSDGSWGAVVTDTISGIQNPNFGGCVAIVDPSNTGVECAKSGEYLTLCEASACDPTCASASTQDQLDCENQAGTDTGPCSQYATAADTCVSYLKNGAYDTCGLSAQDSYNDSVLAVAAILCEQ